jgi:hypothetical protein
MIDEHGRDCVPLLGGSIPLIWPTRPGVAEMSWSTPTTALGEVAQGTVIALTGALVLQGVLVALPNMQLAHRGALASFRYAGKSPRSASFWILYKER